MFPVIEKIEVKARFRFLWLKYVDSVDLNQHCAKCLLGEFSKKISNQITLQENIALDEVIPKYYYLCGVSLPYRWIKNFHLAFKYKEGSTLEIDENGISLIIKDAELVRILPYDMRKRKHSKIVRPEFNTCRNWWFANSIAEEADAKN